MKSNKWDEARAGQMQGKQEFIEKLLDEREKLHERHLVQIVQEEVHLGTRLLRIQDRGLPPDSGVANALYISLARLQQERRNMHHALWREKMQLRLMLEER